METFLQDIFINVVNMSITASYVVFFVLAARLCLKKAPKVFSYILWSAVVFRLVCPFSFSSAFSFLQMIGAGNGKMDYVPSNIAMMAQPQINTGFNSVNKAINSSFPAAAPYASVNPMQIIVLMLTLIWALGIVFLLFYSVISYFMLKRRIRTAILIKNNVYECENIFSPFVTGIIKPKIYLPIGLNDTERSYILKHEQTHIRRFDYLIKPVAFLASCIHWFNPLVWLSFALMTKDMEMSCDEKVLKELGPDLKKEYSTSLLSLATGRKMISVIPLAFGESNTKARIRNVLNYKKPAFWVTVVTIVTVCTLMLGFMANPKITSDLKKIEASSMLFSTQETDLLKIGETAAEHYYSVFKGGDIPSEYRITDYKIKNITLLAGDKNEFCVGITSDYSTTGLYFLSANGDFVPNGTGGECKGDYKEFRIKNLENSKYQIVSIGTGGGTQGLNELNSDGTITAQSTLEATVPKWSSDQIVGADMAVLDYASERVVIFHGYFGLYVYDLNSMQLFRSLDLKPIECEATQGDRYCEVSVSMDGNTVQLHPINSKNMYVYTVSDNKLYETEYKLLDNAFGSQFVPIKDAVGVEAGNYSYHAVRFNANEYGYLYTYDDTLGTLSYTRSDMMYALFQSKKVH